MKTTDLIQTRFTRFQNVMLGNNWRYWFEHQDLKFNIWQIKGLDINRVCKDSSHNLANHFTTTCKPCTTNTITILIPFIIE
jgi:hypothetical protein